MMKAVVLILAVALLWSNANAGDYDNKCKDAIASKCQAKASVNIVSRGPVKCTATAKAFCKAKAVGRNCFDTNTFYLTLKKCRQIDVTIDAECWARAAAKAIAKASAEADCIGGKPGYTLACGKSFANAKAVACVTAKAIVDLKVALGDHDNAICEAKVAGAIDAIAQAAASASAAACVGPNESAIDNEFALAKAIEKVVVEVFASCWVYCKDTPKKEVADVVASGGVFADTVKSVEKEIEKNGGQAKASTGHD